MKRVLSIFLAVLLVMSLCACGGAPTVDESKANEPEIGKLFQDIRKGVQPKDIGRDHSGKDVLKKGDTKKVAETVAVGIQDIYASALLPLDNYKIKVDVEVGGKHMELWQAVRGSDIVLRNGTKIDGKNLLTRLFTVGDGIYFHYTGWIDDVKSKAFYKLPDSAETNALKTPVTFETFGFDADKVGRIEYLGVVDNCESYQLFDLDGREYTYLASTETGQAVGLDFVSDDMKFSIRYTDASDQDFNFLADVNVAESCETAVVADIMEAQLVSVLGSSEV